MSAADAEIPRPLNGVRDVASAAFQRAMSNGSISRRLGWAALVLLPLTFPAQIPLVLLGGPQVMRTRRAASLQLGRTAHVRPAAVIASVSFALLTCVYVAIADFVFGLPGWLVYSVFLALVVVELAGAILAAAVRRAWRALRHRPGPLDLATAVDLDGQVPVSVTFVVAFPRDGGRGSALMAGLEVVLDAASEPAELTARTAGLIEFYQRHGFRSLHGDPRQMIRHPRPDTGTVQR
jgi:hypothetical protein